MTAKDETRSLVKIHEDFREVLSKKDYRLANKMMSYFLQENSSVSELKTVLIITKAFKDNSVMKENRVKILELIESKLGKKLAKK